MGSSTWSQDATGYLGRLVARLCLSDETAREAMGLAEQIAARHGRATVSLGDVAEAVDREWGGAGAGPVGRWEER